MEKSLGNSPTRMTLNLSREHFLQPPGIGMWHKGIPSSPGQSSAAKAAKPIPFLQTYMGGNSPFCHWTIQDRGGKEKKEKKIPSSVHHFREKKGIHHLLSYLTSKWKRQETRLFPPCIRRERKQDRKRAGSSQRKVRRDVKLPHALMAVAFESEFLETYTPAVEKGVWGGGQDGFLSRSTCLALFCICMLHPKCYTT